MVETSMKTSLIKMCPRPPPPPPKKIQQTHEPSWNTNWTRVTGFTILPLREKETMCKKSRKRLFVWEGTLSYNILYISLPSLQQYLAVPPSRVDQTDPARHGENPSISSELKTSARLNEDAYILLWKLPVPQQVLEDHWGLVDQVDPKTRYVMWEKYYQFINLCKWKTNVMWIRDRSLNRIKAHHQSNMSTLTLLSW